MTPPTLQQHAPCALQVSAPGKINLTLRVLGKRPDGFHEIRSLVLGVGLRDTLTLEPTSDAEIWLACTCSDLAADEKNLAVRAARLLADSVGGNRDVRMRLEKRIPIGGGMGGGSADAAAALLGLNRLWACGWTESRLAELGSHVGSDVPVFFSLPAAEMTGRGELVKPVSLGWSGWVLLVIGGFPVSTANVYRAWRGDEGSIPPAGAETLPASDAENAADLLGRSFNDLESAVCAVAPKVSELRNRAARLLDRPLRISGAGSTLFTLYDEREEAEAAAAALEADGLHSAVAEAGAHMRITSAGGSHGDHRDSREAG